MISSISFFSLFFISTSAISIESQVNEAINNRTLIRTNIVQGFVQSPSFRGTTDILWSCSVTLFACVYTCIHLHIPKRGTSTWRRIADKLKWAMTALVVPELVLYNATKQFQQAQKLVDLLNHLSLQSSIFQPRKVKRSNNQLSNAKEGESLLSLMKKTSIETPVRITKHPAKFTLAYGFFVIMGGISVATDSLHPHQSQIVLTHHGVELLARNGHYIEVSDEEIAARSKANALAKALVCVQVSWMALQCAVRAVNGYPLALLEITTMVHVVCAICIYIIWWKKPMDASAPILVDGSKFEELLVMMLMSTALEEGGNSELEKLRLLREPISTSREENNAVHCVQTSQIDHQPTTRSLSHETPNITLYPGECLAGGLEWSPKNTESIILTPKDIRRWHLCIEALSKNIDFETTTYPFQVVGNRVRGARLTPFERFRCELLQSSATPNGLEDTILGHPEGLIEHSEDQGAFIPYFLSAFVYSYIIFAGMPLQFSSVTEGLLWSWSCNGILWLPSPMMFAGIFKIPMWLGVLYWPTTWGFYALSRLYIIVEAFLSLRLVPIGVYMTVPWLLSVPHF